MSLSALEAIMSKYTLMFVFDAILRAKTALKSAQIALLAITVSISTARLAPVELPVMLSSSPLWQDHRIISASYGNFLFFELLVSQYQCIYN